MKSILLAGAIMLMSVFAFAQVPAPTPVGSVAVAEPAAPPAWAEKMIVTLSEVPVIGPVISKVLLYAGIVSSSLTAIIAFLLSVMASLGGIFKFAGLADLAAKLEAFKSGKVMYYLKYLSMFNAKKPEDKPQA